VPDLDLRLVRYFVAVARHRHFGRAAEELLVAQPSLSRQVRRLEQAVGGALLDRGPRGTSLTPAGEAFLPRAEELLRAADRATASVREAARPPRLTVGWTGNLVVTADVATMRREHPDAEVRSQHVGWDAAPRALLDHDVDVVLARRPLAGGGEDGLDVVVLHEEGRALLLPAGHRLAGRASVTVADFASEALVRFPDEAYNAFWRLDPRPDGSPAPDGPLVDDYLDKRELVAAGDALVLVPAGPASTGGRDDLVTVPVRGVPPIEVVLATRADDDRPLVAAYRRVVLDRIAGGLRSVG